MQWDEGLEARRSAIQYIPQSLAVGQLLEAEGVSWSSRRRKDMLCENWCRCMTLLKGKRGRRARTQYEYVGSA